MVRIIVLVLLLVIQASFAKAQLHLSPVNTGDCVAARISAKRTVYVDDYFKKYCAQNKDKEKERKCLENTRSETEFSFFTDRCSEGDYFIGINGNEVQLKKTSKTQGRQHHFMGSYSANGIRVVINNPRLVKKKYMAGEQRNESNVEDAEYKVDVTVTKGTTTKTFKDVVLWYGM
ncbi:MAG TPA: hypothetical protein VF622_10265 [Segetibacter sp.]|jgi:hypothetical protein